MDGGDNEGPRSLAQDSSIPPAACQIFVVLEGATGDFDRRFCIREDSSRSIFRGTLPTGQIIAVKRLNHCNENVFRETLQMLSRQHHPNLINLVGNYTIHEEHFLLFEYVSSDLGSRLHNPPTHETEPLTWSMRMKIAAGVAKGLNFLHNKADPPVIYGDLQSYNVLLVESLDVKLFDAFRHKLEASSSNVNSRGYRAPECSAGQATFKSDVYGFGILLLELITGQKVFDLTRGNGNELLIDWIEKKMTGWKFDAVIDPILETCSSVMLALKIALTCTDEVQLRPTMNKATGYIEKIISERGPFVQKFTFNELACATDHFTIPIFVGEKFGIINNFGIGAKGALLESEGEGKQRDIAIYAVDGISLKYVYLRSGLRHQNISGLVGYCLEPPACIVTEYEPSQRTLASHLTAGYGDEKYLDWIKRVHIAREVAEAIYYLHNVAIPPVFCGDVTSTCILLGSEVKLCMYRSLVDKNLPGYRAPEISRSGKCTYASDIYSYGVLLFELITGRKGFDVSVKVGSEVLVEWAKAEVEGPQKARGILDCHISMWGFDCDEALERATELASRCVEKKIENRPSIKEVIEEMRLVYFMSLREIEIGKLKKEEEEKEFEEEEKEFDSC